MTKENNNWDINLDLVSLEKERGLNFLSINNNNPNDNSQNSPPSLIKIVVPNPPTIKARDYVRKKNGKWPTKPVNCFMLYRKAYLDELKLKNVKLPMQDVSKLVSDSWVKEKKSVRVAYENLAKEIDRKLLNLRNKNSISNQDIYFYNHNHLTTEQLRNYYSFSSVSHSSSSLPSYPRKSQVNNSSDNYDNDDNDNDNNDNCDNVQLIHHQDSIQRQNRSLSTRNSGHTEKVTRTVNEDINNVVNNMSIDSNYNANNNVNDASNINNYYVNNDDEIIGQQQQLSSTNIYLLPNIRNDHQSVYKFNSSSDIGLIATTPNEKSFSTNFLLNYQNKDQGLINVGSYGINDDDNYASDFNATNNNNFNSSNYDDLNNNGNNNSNNVQDFSYLYYIQRI